MTATFSTTTSDYGYTTYSVFNDNSEYVGETRVRKPNNGAQKWTIKHPGESHFSRQFSTRAAAATWLITSRTRMKEEPKMPETPRTGPQDIVCSCGHKYRYNIKRTSAIDWLKGKPCPSCQHGKTTPDSPQPAPEEQPEAPKEEEPTPEPEPEPKEEPKPDNTAAINEVLAAWPSIPEDRPLHSAFADLLLMVNAGLPVWLQGPPGTGKSTLAEQVADALKLTFHPMSCHEMMTRTDLFGYRDATGTDHRTPLWDAFEYGGVALLDEVDNGNPNLLAALNSAMANGHCVFGSGTVVVRHPNFRVVATANTAGLGPEAGYIGRNGVDLATRDRFVTLQVSIDSTLEGQLAAEGLGDADLAATTEAMSYNHAVAALRARATRVVEEDVKPEDLLRTVAGVRRLAESRFRGTVVSPRATLHAARMVSTGFTVAESMAAKLVGLTDSEVSDLMAGV
jgi:MoxR-like ATPase